MLTQETLNKALENPGEDTVDSVLSEVVLPIVSRDLIILTKEISKDLFGNDVEAAKESLLVTLNYILSVSINTPEDLKKSSSEYMLELSENQKLFREELMLRLKAIKANS